MTEPVVDGQKGTQATLRQIAASNPNLSVFVSANAGTGKTQVLTMRVLRLLLSGISPETILCVTYTKAAAAEMKSRLYKQLSIWAICDQTDLLFELKKLGEDRPTQAQIQTARSLFANILDHEDGPRIETLHSFCQAVLRRFPVEAKVPPEFQLLSEMDSDRLVTDCFFDLLQQVGQLHDTLLAEALSVIIQQTDEKQALKHIKTGLHNRHNMQHFTDDPLGLSDNESELRQQLGVEHKVDLIAAEQELAIQIRQMPLARIITALLKGGLQQADRGHQLQVWLEVDEEGRPMDIAALADVFLTKDGGWRKNLTDKKVDAYDPECAAFQAQIIERLGHYFKLKSAERCVLLSQSLARVSAAVYQQFQARKFAAGMLDYEDLIFFTDKLLAQEQMMAWVRWKLDQGINHLLIDEAQDTSPAQWELLDRLSASFFDGDEEAKHKTVFAVGDYKQSIYSFQGADPKTFADQKQTWMQRASAVLKPFDVIDFTLSFRSSQAVLSFVDCVMSADEVTGLGSSAYRSHDVFRTGMPGLVEVWPATTGEEKTELPLFDAPDLSDHQDNDARHANAVVAHIKDLLAGNEVKLFCRAIRPQDILILVRKRDTFYALLRAELERENIPVAGADRIVLNNQIEILDLLALGDVCLLPEDDLQLACLLKSPLLGLTEDELFELATGRGEASLFDALVMAAETGTPFAEAAKKLLRWLGLADQLPVFEFFSLVLTEGGRQAFHSRLGPAVDDSLNAFLLQTREHGQHGQAGLTHFLNFFRQGGSEVKRDMDTEHGGQIRVMSIHGAKGLEAPIVYLPDMLRPTHPSSSLVQTPTGLYWPSGQSVPLDMIEQMKQSNKKIRDEEDFRLLYVALTRAQQALFVSGWQRPRQRMPENSWHDLLARQIQHCAGAIQNADGVWRLETPGEDITSQDDAMSAVPLSAGVPPAWYFREPEPETTQALPLVPSDLGEPDQIVAFTAANRRKALLRGQFVHKLFEILPYLPADKWSEAAEKIAASLLTGVAALNHQKGLTRADIQMLLRQATAVMADKRLCGLFGPDALAEAAISGKVGHLVVQGQVDRLVVRETDVLLADFKTGTPPTDKTDMPVRYVRQMAVYAELLSQIYPAKKVTCWVIWTQTAEISIISDAQIQVELASLIARD